MFEQTDASVDKTRSRIIMVLAGIGVALIIAAIAIFGAFDSRPPEAERPPPGIPGAKHAGDPEFEQYSRLVAIVNKKFYTQANMLGQRQAVATGTVANFTDKTVLGIELRGTVYGEGGKVMATTVAMPVPRRYESISPKGSIPFAITIDGVPRDGEIEDITVELEGLVMGQ
jgi:hypothetical protein